MCVTDGLVPDGIVKQGTQMPVLIMLGIGYPWIEYSPGSSFLMRGRDNPATIHQCLMSKQVHREFLLVLCSLQTPSLQMEVLWNNVVNKESRPHDLMNVAWYSHSRYISCTYCTKHLMILELIDIPGKHEPNRPKVRQRNQEWPSSSLNQAHVSFIIPGFLKISVLTYWFAIQRVVIFGVMRLGVGYTDLLKLDQVLGWNIILSYLPATIS